MKKSTLAFAFYLAFEVGFLLAVPIVVLLLGGLWLDSKLHTFPICTIFGSLVGFIGGIINTYRVIIKLMEK